MDTENDDRAEVGTYFVVVVQKDGEAFATGDMAVLDHITRNHEPSIDEMYTASAVVMRDVDQVTMLQKFFAQFQAMAATAQQRPANEPTVLSPTEERIVKGLVIPSAR